MKKYLSWLFIPIYLFLCGEIALRILSNIITISNFEKLKYAKNSVIANNDDNIFKKHIPNSKYKLMDVDIEFNSLGHRGDEINSVKRKNEIRIMALGSSLVMGWGVNEQNTFLSILKKKISQIYNENNINKNVKTINAGIMHTNTNFHYHLFKSQYKKIDPDILVLGYFIDDAKKLDKAKLPFFIKNSYLNAFIYQKIQAKKSSEKLEDYYKRINFERSENWKNVINSIRNISNICKKNNIKLILVILPEFTDFSEKNKLASLYKDLEIRFQKENLLVINTYRKLKREFEKNPELSWISKDDSHPNKMANEIIANEIFEFVEKNTIFLN